MLWPRIRALLPSPSIESAKFASLSGSLLSHAHQVWSVYPILCHAMFHGELPVSSANAFSGCIMCSVSAIAPKSEPCVGSYQAH